MKRRLTRWTSLLLTLVLVLSLVPAAGAAEDDANRVRSFDTSGYHSAAVMENGDLYVWGRGDYGQIGCGPTDQLESTTLPGGPDRYPIQTKPTKVLDDVASVSTFGLSTAAVMGNGDLYTWGANYNGQLGNGSKKDADVPGKVLENVTSVHGSAAITKNGELYIWGDNYYGQVGNGTLDNQLTPYKVLEDVASVYTGLDFTAAITKSGDLYFWGAPCLGSTDKGIPTGAETMVRTNGDGLKTVAITRPVKIMEGVDSFSANNSHFAVVTTKGELYVWGGDYYDDYQNTPVKLRDNVAAVDCSGWDGDTVLTTDGTLYELAWKDKDFNKPVWTKVLDGVAQIDNGQACRSAVTKNGDLYAWGNPSVGTSTSKKVLGSVVSAMIGYQTALALTTDGKLYAWGRNTFGGVGNGSTENVAKPTLILGGEDHTETKPQEPKPEEKPVDPKPEEKPVQPTGDWYGRDTFDISGPHGVAITEDGAVYGWGRNDSGQIGNPVEMGTVSWEAGSESFTRSGRTSPGKFLENAAAVSTTNSCTVTLTQDGDLLQSGKSGAKLLLSNVVSLQHTSGNAPFETWAAITADGSLYTWGSNYCGVLGVGTVGSVEDPGPHKILDNMAAVYLQTNQCAALSRDGDLYIWGAPVYYFVDVDIPEDAETAIETGGDKPTKIIVKPYKILSNVASFRMSMGHIAVTTNGDCYAWGGTPRPKKIASGIVDAVWGIGRDYFLYPGGKLTQRILDGPSERHEEVLLTNAKKLVDTGVITKEGVFYPFDTQVGGLLPPVDLGSPITDVKSAIWTTLALTEKGELYSWSSLDNDTTGITGTGEAKSQLEPVKILDNVALPGTLPISPKPYEDTGAIRVLVNGEEIKFDQPPVVVEGRTMVPLRGVFEAMGIAVEWEQATRTIRCRTKADTLQIIMSGDKPQITFNGQPMTFEVDPMILNGRTLVPLRAIAEAFQAQVGWSGTYRTVTIGRYIPQEQRVSAQG